MYNKKTRIHFVGIGGIGMSGIATILKNQGYTISGCDNNLAQASIKNLQKLKCDIFHGNNTPHCQKHEYDVLVYSSAINAANPEIISAQQKGIPTISRALMLAELMRTKYSIAIAGSHGKTTTTSLISHILIEAGIDPTVIIGGHLKNLSTNARFGAGDFLVAEADESDRSLLHLQSTLAVVTNIDLEHLETYKDLEDIKQTFKQFLNNLPFYGKAILCIDDPNVQTLLPMPHIKTILYGLTPRAHFYATNITLHPSHSEFDIHHHEYGLLGSINLNMPGKHNIQNAVAAIALAYLLSIDMKTIAQALQSFKGIERRFSFNGMYNDVEIFDDYGHHPIEIENTLKVACNRTKNKVTVVFQPHRYSRTHHLWNNFVQTFVDSGIDHLIITDIYPAFETPIPGVTSKQLVQSIAQCNPSFTITYIPFEPQFKEIKKQIHKLLQKNDLLLILGAGKVNQLAQLLIS